MQQFAFDVAVVGGGTAGVFAAISAARRSAKTVLIEKNAMLGGTMTAGGVNFPGLFHAWGRQIIDGPCWEAVKRVEALGGANMPEISFRPKRHWHEQIRLNRFLLTAVLSEMCTEAGVTVLCNTMLASAAEQDGVTLCLTGKTEQTQILAKVVIDATGDANLVSHLGYALQTNAAPQPATLQNAIAGYRLEDVDRAALAAVCQQLPDYLNADKLWHFLCIGKLDLHIPASGADSSAGKTKLDFAALSQMLRVYRALRTVKGLENLEVTGIAQETGVRETNRILGETTVTVEEYLAGKHFKDSVCYAFYPVDLHVMHGIEQRFQEENVVARVPYRALIPKGAARVLCAGRCLSSDVYANSALRVEAVCMATGQAAGCAAAIAAKENKKVSDVPYTALCDALRAIGAIVPQETERTENK